MSISLCFVHQGPALLSKGEMFEYKVSFLVHLQNSQQYPAFWQSSFVSVMLILLLLAETLKEISRPGEENSSVRNCATLMHPLFK